MTKVKQQQVKVDIGGDASKNGFNFVNTYVQEAGTGEKPDPNKPRS